MAPNSAWKAPWDAFLQWMSATVATRIFLAFPWGDRGGPALDILRGQLSVGSEPPILITPPGYVRQVLLPGQECSPAQALIGRRPSRVPLQGTAKPEHDVVRNGPSLTGIDEAEQDQVAQEHPPVRPEPVQQPAPIEAPATGSNQVRHVCSVVPLTLHHERLRPDHLLGRAELDRHAEDDGGVAAGEPVVIDLGEAVPRSVDHVDTVALDTRLAQPVRKREVRLEAGRRHPIEESLRVRLAHEDVQVLRTAHASGIVAKRMAAPNEKRDVQARHQLERSAMTPAPYLPPRDSPVGRSRSVECPHDVSAVPAHPRRLQRLTTSSASPRRERSSTAAVWLPRETTKSRLESRRRRSRISTQSSHEGKTGLIRLSRLSRASGDRPSIALRRWKGTPAAHAWGEHATG